MKEFKMAIAALMLSATAMLVVGCKKPNIVGGGTHNGHEYIDLGLPSGTLWATCNVGADAPEEYGDYFAWGETEPKLAYQWSNYKYCNGSGGEDEYSDDGWKKLTKYCTDSEYGDNGFTDGLSTLLPEDDAATANWGDGWCMPSKTQMDELVENTSFKWTTLNGVNGVLFKSRNGNGLFLPAVGYRMDNGLHTDGEDGAYWLNSNCSSIYPEMSNPCNAENCHVRQYASGTYYINISYGGNRCFGFAVRPVCSAR